MAHDPACFLRGTRIRTDRGERAIETLRIGDRVLSWRTGEQHPIRWIGRRTIRGVDRLTAGDRRVHLPVLIQRHAFADNSPSRDLRLSPGHGLVVKGYRLPVRHLINGTTVRQVMDIETIDGFHIELDTHDGIYAENVVAETYIECDNRHAYDNAAEYERLYPGDDPRVQAPCVAIGIPASLVEHIRARIDQRAVMLMEMAEV